MNEAQAAGRKRDVLAVAAIAATAAFCAFIPSLQNGFVNWDDGDYLSALRSGRSFFSFLKWAFSTFAAANYHPLTWLSLGLDHAIWGEKPFGYHLTNSILHGMNVFFVVLIAAELAGAAAVRTESRPRRFIPLFAGLAGLLFGLHPQRVESVAWVSERKDVLCALFYLSSLLSYLRYAASGNRRSYICSLVAFFMSLLSKPMAVTLPVILVILDAYPLRRQNVWKKTAAEKAPYFVLAAIFSLLTVKAQSAEAVVALSESGAVLRGAIAVRAVFFYLETFFLPLRLSPFYPISMEIGTGDMILFLCLVVLTSGVLLFRRRLPALAAAWFFYIISLLPVLGLLQVGSQAAADRYTYIPMLGPTLLLSSCIVTVIGGRALSRRALVPAILIFAALIVGLAGLTVRQSLYWRDPASLWRRQIELHFTDTFGYKKLGEYYYRSGDTGKALHYYSMVLQMTPGDYRTLFDRGVILFISGRYDEAKADFERVMSTEHSYRNNPSFVSLTIQIKSYLSHISKKQGEFRGE